MKKQNKLLAIKQYFKSYTEFSMWRIVAYFIIYSFFGFFVETIYGFISKGVLECRQSFLYGPFCAIYGVGAVIMIVSLNAFKNNNNRLFWGGFVVGSLVEYFVSLIGETIFHVKWWDYSNMPLNIAGRACVYFSVFWGLLGIYLVSYVNPKVDKLLNFIKRKISIMVLKPIEVIVSIIIILDLLVTMYALRAFYVRTVVEHDVDVNNKESVIAEYERIYGNTKKAELINNLWGNEKMVKTFPNLKFQNKDNETLYFDSFYKEVTPYYYKMPKK